MRFRTVVASVVMLAGWLGCAGPQRQAAEPAPGSPDISADSAAIAGMVGRLLTLYNTGAFDSVKSLLADDFQQVEGGTRVTGDQYVNAIRALHISDAAGTFSFQRIVVSGDIAYQTCDGEMAFKAGGSPATMKEQGTMVLRRTPSGWRIAVWHITPR